MNDDKTLHGRVFNLRLYATYDGEAYYKRGELDFTVELIDACFSPIITLPQSQTNPPDYYYTQASPAAEFKLNKFVASPASCPVTYSCGVTSGPRTDICDTWYFTTSSSFDTVTGDYTLHTLDVPNYPPGDYVFEITGVAGTNADVSEVITFTLKMIDPCPDSSLSLIIPSWPSTTEYVLRDSELTLTWDDLASNEVT